MTAGSIKHVEQHFDSAEVNGTLTFTEKETKFYTPKVLTTRKVPLHK